MSGGTAYVLDLDGRPGQPRAGRPRPGRRTTSPTSSRDAGRAGTSRRPTRRSPQALLADWAGTRRRGSPRSCRATTAACSRRGPSALRRRPRRRRGRPPDHGGAAWLTPEGFLKHGRELAERRPVAVRILDWHEVYPGGPGRALLPIITTQAGRCMDCGIPFCHQGCPLGQPDPGVERPDLARRLGRRDRAAARDQQLPGVHRPAVPGAVRDRLRARHQPGPGDDQAGRGLDHRPGLGRGLRRAAAARAALRPDGRRRRLRSGRPGRRPAADPRRPHGRGLRAGRPDRRPAALRHPRVQDGEGRPRPPARPDAAEGTVFRTGVDVGADLTGDRAARPLRRRRARHRVDRRPATCRCPGRELGGHPPGDGVPARSPTGSRWATTCREPDHRRRQARRHHRRRRHRRRLPRHRAPPGRRVGHPARDPARAARRAARRPAVADVPDDLPRLLAPTRRAATGSTPSSTQEFLGDESGRVRALRLVEVDCRRPFQPRSRAPSARSRPTWCCSRWASPARSSRAWSSSSGSSSTRAATSPATRRTPRASPGVFVAGDAGRGQSLIVWAIAEGRSRGRGRRRVPDGRDQPALARSRRPPVRSSSEPPDGS